jgi:hypothetical protein
MTHTWNDQFCSCGQDSVTCQIGGELICGNLVNRIPGFGNVCDAHNSLRNPETIIARITDPRLRHTVRWG